MKQRVIGSHFKPFLRSFCFVLVLSFAGCSHLFFQPSQEKFSDPIQEGHMVSDVFFKSKNGKTVHGWFFANRSGKPTKGTFVLFHGNSENITTFYRTLSWIPRFGYEYLIFDYEGYGQSEGSASQENAVNDGVAAIMEMKKRFDKKETPGIYVLGQSLGGALALRSVYEIKDRSFIKGIVVDSAFVDYKKIAREKMSNFFLTWPFQWLPYLLISNEYSPKDIMAELSPIPILVIHGTNDQTVLVHHGQDIYDAAAQPKKYWQIPDGEHIDAFFGHGGVYRKKLLDYLNTPQK